MQNHFATGCIPVFWKVIRAANPNLFYFENYHARGDNGKLCFPVN